MNESRDNAASPAAQSPNRLPNRLTQYEPSDMSSSGATTQGHPPITTEGTMSMPIIEDPALLKGNSQPTRNFRNQELNTEDIV